MGAIVLLVILIFAMAVGVPTYALLDWKFSYQKRGETFKEYLAKF